ncbi:MAG: protein-export membrane protein SecD [Ignavibacteria bacterium GWB2_36_8]|nr:MAG: protein-export membrane protein SecD [Ignavibacteria bacterium GWB2_36_8]OGU52820.1 MAG: protein-export membrane protein SecD [Ignavibacteria bacterium GWC2_36_12]
MKEFRFKIIIILGAIALSIYLLYPTYVDYQNSKEISQILEKKREEIKETDPEVTSETLKSRIRTVEDSIKTADPSIQEARQKRIKLGLDLQGGMRVVLEVNTGRLLEKLAKDPDQTFKDALNSAQAEASLSDEPVVDILARNFEEKGIRLSRYFGSVRDDDNTIISNLKSDAEDAVSRAMEIIRNRVDQYGVAEPSIQRQGSRRIIVELPGVAREEEAKQLLQGTALLEFRIVKDPEFTIAIMQNIDKVLAGKIIDDTTKTDSSLASNEVNKDTSTVQDTTKELSEEEFKKEHPFFSVAIINPQGRTADAFIKEDERNKITLMLNRPEVQKVIPNNVEFVFSAKSFIADNGNEYYTLYLVNKNPELTGGVITDANANIDPSTSAPIVNMTMDSDGATQWARITGANVGKRIAIILDGVVFSAPNVKGKIPGGRSQIEGMENMEEAKLLEIVLKAGALPAPVDIIEERTVGPSLGEDSINKGVIAGTAGFIITVIFLIIYYQKSGSVGSVALIFTVLFTLGVMAGFNATLTLPGIAGIILTITMSIDSNVLIYERIREELAVGKTIKASIDSGFSRALSAIVDSNVTTFFSGIILYQFGTGPIQGFALTLMIGIVASMFSALVVTRVILDYMVYKGAKITVG